MLARTYRFMATLALLPVGSALAGEPPAEVTVGVQKLLPGVEIDRVVETPMSGLYEVAVGPTVFYMSGDGRFLIQGSLVDVESRENLTEISRSKVRKLAIDQVGEDRMVIFDPQQLKHTVTVFTDIDCGYCRKLHNEMAGYNEKGIRVRYLFFPRAGTGSPSYDKAVSVWCADDRNLALTEAKSGKDPEKRQCENPVAEHLELGKAMGVTGTPAIVLDDGELLPGYIPAERLSAYLDAKGPSTSAATASAH